MLTILLLALAFTTAIIGFVVKSGVEVSGQRNAWRNYFKVLGVTFGRWQGLPPISGVTLKYYSSLAKQSSTTVGDVANWSNSSRRDEQLILMLSVAGSKKGIILRTSSLPELATQRAFAKEIARELGVPVREFLSSGTGE